MSRMLVDNEKKNYQKFFVPIQDSAGNPTWPEVFGEDACSKIRQDVTLSAWHSEYLLQPISGDTQIFQESWAQQTWNNMPDLSEFDRIVAASDPSTTSSKSSDFKATVVVGRHKEENKAYILRVICERVSVNQYVARLHEVSREFGCTIYVEDNGIKEFLYKAVRDYEAEHACHLKIEFVTHGGSKNQRIQGTLENPCERGLIVFPPMTHGHTRQLIDQLLAFPNGQNDDAIDALAEAYQRLMEGGGHVPRTTGQQRTFTPPPSAAVPRYF